MIEVAKMPVASAQTRHRWPQKELWNVVIAQDSSDGNEHHVRQCLVCEMTKITVIDPFNFAWHEWVTPHGLEWVGESTPPCGVEKSSASQESQGDRI